MKGCINIYIYYICKHDASIQGYSTDSQYGWQVKVYKDPLQLDNLTSRKGLTNATHALGEGPFAIPRILPTQKNANQIPPARALVFRYQVIQAVTFSSPSWRSLTTPKKGHVNSPSQKGHKDLPGTVCFLGVHCHNHLPQQTLWCFLKSTPTQICLAYMLVSPKLSFLSSSCLCPYRAEKERPPWRLDRRRSTRFDPTPFLTRGFFEPIKASTS